MPQQRWSPWGALAAHPDIWVARVPLEEGRGWWVPGERVILLDSRLSRRSLRCVLAHELAHAVLGHAYPDGYGHDTWLAARLEAQADRWAGERLLPVDRLAQVLAAALLDVEAVVLRRRLDGLDAAERRLLRDAVAHHAA